MFALTEFFSTEKTKSKNRTDFAKCFSCGWPSGWIFHSKEMESNSYLMDLNCSTLQRKRERENRKRTVLLVFLGKIAFPSNQIRTKGGRYTFAFCAGSVVGDV